MEKINIAELLKDCPKGMELDCTMCDNVTFVGILDGNCFPIQIQTPEGNVWLSKYGCMSLSRHAKCIIFPKGKTTWEGFHRPFKDGDIVFTTLGNIAIIRKPIEVELFYVYGIMVGNGFYKDETAQVVVERHATEEEKQKLFKAIKEHGYKWNAETKTLEKLPKFKVGDKIVQKNSACTTILITNVGDEFYYSNTESSVGVLPISEQDDWELVSNKFDINTLVPFESKVLIRDGNTDKWKPNFWGFYNSDIANNYPYECCGDAYQQCIPYEGNEHLLGKKDDCDEYFKNW